MHRVSKLKLSEVTPYLVCKLCDGYFIDPCTAQDCLHTFCKTCIVKHLYQHCTCPICGVIIHKTRPLEMIRHDQTMQDLVYKLIPGVFGKEMERRREFYADYPQTDPLTHGSCEDRGELKEDREILVEDDCISMALVHSPTGELKAQQQSTDIKDCTVTYLRCPANFTISGLKKFIRAKYDLPSEYLVDVFYSDESLSDDYTLMDIAYIYTWRRRGPLRVFFSIYEFDEEAAEDKLKVAPSADPPTSGRVIEVDENVTIVELNKSKKETSTAEKTNNKVELVETSQNTTETSNTTAATAEPAAAAEPAVASGNSSVSIGDSSAASGNNSVVAASENSVKTDSAVEKPVVTDIPAAGNSAANMMLEESSGFTVTQSATPPQVSLQPEDAASNPPADS